MCAFRKHVKKALELCTGYRIMRLDGALILADKDQLEEVGFLQYF